MQCQAGDQHVRNELLTQYKPYILKTASKICKRFLDEKRDDEFSVALAAFNEAIDTFDIHRQGSFLLFVEKIIRNKLVDFFRREKKHLRNIPISTLMNQEFDDEDWQNPTFVKEAMDRYELEQLHEARRLEIAELQTVLREYKISFHELVERAPRHDDSRKMLLELAQILARDDHTVRFILNNKKLPLNEIENISKVSRKTIERHRKYLILLVLLLEGSYPFVKSFLNVQTSTEEEAESL